VVVERLRPFTEREFRDYMHRLLEPRGFSGGEVERLYSSLESRARGARSSLLDSVTEVVQSLKVDL
jgi:hypothetical protein